MDEDKIRAFEDALDDLSRGSFDAAQTLNDLENAGDKNLTYLEKAEKAWNDYFRQRPLARMAKDTAKFTGQLGKAFIESGMAARENRESFDALKPVINAVSQVFKAIPIAGSGLSEAFSGVANFVVDEVQKTVTAYQTLGNVGATTAGGMTAMRDQAIQAGLSFQQFSEITKNNAESLAFFGGSTAEGMKALAGVTQAAKPFQSELLNLGVGISEQSELFADYLGMSRRLGRQQQGDYNAQAESARRYVMQLDELSRITGKTKEMAQQDLDAQLSNIRFRATLAQMEAEGSGLQAEQLRQYVAALPKDLQQGAMDLVGGAATEAGRAVEIALGGEGSQIFAGLKSGAIDANEGLARAQEAAQATIERVGNEYFARAGGLGGPLDSTAIGLFDLSQNAAFARDALLKVGAEQLGAAETQDKATKAVVDAQQSMQQFAIEMDKFVQSNVFPLATEAIAGLSGSLADLAGFINETIGGGGSAEPSWYDSIIDFVKGRKYKNEEVDLDFAAADGAYVRKGQLGLVGEHGPELFAPSQSGNVMNKEQIVALYELLGKQGVAQLNENVSSAFLPGIGFLNRFSSNSMQIDKLMGFSGEEKLNASKYDAGGLTMQNLQAAGQTIRQGGYTHGLDAAGNLLNYKSGFASTSGPGSYYDRMMSGVSPFAGSSLNTNFKGRPGTEVGVGSTADMVEFQKEMYDVLSQIAQNTRTGADTSKQILRVSSS